MSQGSTDPEVRARFRRTFRRSVHPRSLDSYFLRLESSNFRKEIMKFIPFDFWIHLLVLQLYSNPYLHRYLHQAEACLDLQNLEVFHLMLISFGHLHLFCHLIYHLLRPSVLQFQLTSVHLLKFL